jgi:CheY-like chemotaxis protein
MPRLLLVDDNPSIHRIAESLLAPTDVELVCVASAAEALDRIGRGERFDVALIDTAMPGMDGWTLLSRFRDMDETMRMPIALMAGVLDPVDPSKLAKAPIQGFLKKPIELRELGDRIKALLATPVLVGPSPFSTVPATPSRDLLKRAEEALPEFRPEPIEELPDLEEITEPADLAPAAPELTSEPAPEPASEPAPETALELEEDLLLLTAEDLWPEEPPKAPEEPAPAVPAPHEVHLELEELDLDSLQDLTGGPHPGEPLPAPAAGPGRFTPELDDDPMVTLSGLEELPADFDFPPAGALLDEEVAPEDSLAHLPVAASLIGLPEAEEGHATLEPVPGAPGGAVEELVQELSLEPEEDLSFEPALEDVPEPVLEVAQEAGAVAAFELLPEPAPELMLLEDLEPASLLEAPSPIPEPAAGGQLSALPGHETPALPPPAAMSPDLARAVVQAMLEDPVLVDALVKAVVGRLGDQVLREVAWELMPDLAGRLHP